MRVFEATKGVPSDVLTWEHTYTWGQGGNSGLLTTVKNHSRLTTAISYATMSRLSWLVEQLKADKPDYS